MTIRPVTGSGALPLSAAHERKTRMPHDTDVRTADHLDRQLREQKEASVDWQLINRNFASAADGDSRRPARERVEGPDDAPLASESHDGERVASGRGQAVSAEFVHAEVHLAQIEVGADGVRITEFDLTYDRLAVRSQSRQPEKKSDPLALDLDGNGRIATSGVDAGQLFDLDADGTTDRASVVTGGDAFLALDRNGNGRIDDGRELFGDQSGAPNGFEALRAYDDNGDGRIDKSDAVFAQLRLATWNADGSQQLRDLAEAGISAISLAYSEGDAVLNETDRIAQTGTFVRDDGRTGLAADLLLGFGADA